MNDYEKKLTDFCGVDDVGDVSDGFHTFNDLYYQRAMLFATIVNQNKGVSWKTHYHEDGEPCFGGGWFLVTIDTPDGAYGYHYEDKYWDYFECKEIPKAKHWDGYTERDVTRLFSLNHGKKHTFVCKGCDTEFNYEDDDVKIFRESIFVTDKAVTCPNCHALNIINSIKYK